MAKIGTMAKIVFSGAWRIGRVTALTLGLAVMLALVVGMASAAFGASGNPWILGQGNVATKLTALGGKLGVDGPMLRLVNNNADANDTALDLQVQSGEAPMRVNSSTKVDNLNADRLDGLNSTDFLPSRIYERESPTVVNANSTLDILPLCNNGDLAISGGYRDLSISTAVLRSERVATDPKRWAFQMRNFATTADEITVEVNCIDLP